MKGRRKGIDRFESFHDHIISISKSIDGLLGVTHGKETSALGQGVLDEGKEVGPLDGGGILEFIDQIMVDRIPYPEVDIRYDFMIEIVRKFLVDVIDKDGPLSSFHILENILEGLVGPEIGGVIRLSIELNIFPYLFTEEFPLFRYFFIRRRFSCRLRPGDGRVNEALVNKIAASGTVYKLSAEEVAMLRKQGVSDRVINFMLTGQLASAGRAAVVQAPVAPQAPAMASEEESFTINIPNNHGGYTTVNLKRSGNGFVGPQGEYYPEFPRIKQLQEKYGK